MRLNFCFGVRVMFSWDPECMVALGHGFFQKAPTCLVPTSPESNRLTLQRERLGELCRRADRRGTGEVRWCFVVCWGRGVRGALRGPRRLKLQSRKWLERVLWPLSGGLRFGGGEAACTQWGLMVPQNLKMPRGSRHHGEAMRKIHKGQTALLGYRRCSLAWRGQMLALTGRCVNPNPSDPYQRLEVLFWLGNEALGCPSIQGTLNSAHSHSPPKPVLSADVSILDSCTRILSATWDSVMVLHSLSFLPQAGR